MKPVVVLTFADSTEDHLPLLKKESKQLMQVLSSFHDRGALEVYREESTTVSDLIRIFNRFDQRICIFHYGGHAGGTRLELEQGAAQADGLARLFSQQKDQLALVFLNGCSTLEQVDRLIALGAKAVIATSVPISDNKAVEFAYWFYQSLAVRRNMESAFKFAAASLQTKYQQHPGNPIIRFRGIQFREAAPDQEAWGLYINENHREVLQWRLPDTPRPRTSFEQNTDFQVNDYLYSILEAMISFKPAIEDSLVDENGNELDEREYLDLIIKNFPWTIGAQIQKLVAFSESMCRPGKPRLEQIVSTYVIFTQLISYMLVSQLWDEAMKNPDQDWTALQELISIDKNSFQVFDYLGNLKQMRRYFINREPFVHEFKDLFEEMDDSSSDNYQAYLFLESMKDALYAQSLSEEEAAQLCEEAEFCLALLLSRIAFLVNYQMIAVRDINLIYQRHKEIEYQHKMGDLNAYSETRLGLHRKPQTFAGFTQSNSVLLVRNLKELDDFISLSPFIIDKNTFLDPNQEALNIYIYTYCQDGNYIYHSVNSNIYNQEQNQAAFIDTDFELVKDIKRGIRFERGVKGIRRRESIKPLALLKEQFETMMKDFSSHSMHS